MKQFLNLICAPTVWVFTIIELILLVFMIVRFIKTKSKITLVNTIITFGLFIDAFLIALGAFIDAESIRGLSRIRFICHGLLIPLLFVICSLSLELKKPWKYIVYGITLLFMIAGLAEAIVTVLGPQYVGGLSRMASIKGETPKWAETTSSILSFGTVFPLMGVGIYQIVKEKNIHLFLSGFFMFLFSALGPATGNTEFIFFISMLGEILMVLFIELYTIKKEKRFI